MLDAKTKLYSCPVCSSQVEYSEIQHHSSLEMGDVDFLESLRSQKILKPTISILQSAYLQLRTGSELLTQAQVIGKQLSSSLLAEINTKLKEIPAFFRNLIATDMVKIETKIEDLKKQINAASGKNLIGEITNLLNSSIHEINASLNSTNDSTKQYIKSLFEKIDFKLLELLTHTQKEMPVILGQVNETLTLVRNSMSQYGDELKKATNIMDAWLSQRKVSKTKGVVAETEVLEVLRNAYPYEQWQKAGGKNEPDIIVSPRIILQTGDIKKVSGRIVIEIKDVKSPLSNEVLSNSIMKIRSYMKCYQADVAILTIPSLEHIPKEYRQLDFIEVDEGIILIATMNEDRNIITTYPVAKIIVIMSYLGKATTIHGRERQELLRKILELKSSLQKQRQILFGVIENLDKQVQVIEEWENMLTNPMNINK
jgi:hypothetical protein